jgi:hypothetical protein
MHKSASPVWKEVRRDVKTPLHQHRDPTRRTELPKPKGLLRNDLVTSSHASCSELWCSSIPHESHEGIC